MLLGKNLCQDLSKFEFLEKLLPNFKKCFCFEFVWKPWKAKAPKFIKIWLSLKSLAVFQKLGLFWVCMNECLKVSKSQKHFFLKLHCPNGQRSFKKITFEIYWPLDILKSKSKTCIVSEMTVCNIRTLQTGFLSSHFVWNWICNKTATILS